jgi:hypothetical protein
MLASILMEQFILITIAQFSKELCFLAPSQNAPVSIQFLKHGMSGTTEYRA